MSFLSTPPRRGVDMVFSRGDARSERGDLSRHEGEFHDPGREEVGQATESLRAVAPAETEDLSGSSSPASTELGDRAALLRRQGAGTRRVLGNYEIRRFLGRGGMGQVFEAFDLELRRPVALKELSSDLAEDESFLRAFRREARLAARLKHPNVCQIWYASKSEDGGQPYFVMELVPGEDLGRTVQREGPLPLTRAVALAREAALGLAHAQEHGLVHRDVKPGNLLVDPDGALRVTDFGLARSLDEASRETRSRIHMATPAYVAPECIRGEDYDQRVDMYGLGGTLFFMLTGRPPYEGRNTGEILQAHLEAPLPSLKSLREGCPAALEELVHALLAKRADGRPATWQRVIDALEAIAHALPEPASTEPLNRGQASERSLSPAIRGRSLSLRRHWKAKLVVLPLLALVAWQGFYLRPGMVRVPGGPYWVGDPADPRSVTLSSFWIESHELSRERHARALGQAVPDAPHRPWAVRSMEEIEGYCDATGLELPTAEQWQAAARGPSGQAFPWGTKIPDRLETRVGTWDDEDLSASFRMDERIEAQGDRAFPVASHPFDRSPMGCWDMAGNQRECVSVEGRKGLFSLGASYRRGLEKESMFRPLPCSPPAEDLGLRCVASGPWTQFVDGAKGLATALVLLAVALLL